MTKLIRTLDWKAVAKALDETPDLIDFRDERGRNWLHLCAAVPMNGAAKLNPKDSIELAQFLIDEGAEPNHALWSAIFSKNIPAIRLLVRSGADVDLVKDWSPLVYCAR